MPRVLVIVANREQFPEPAFPIGALYVAGALEAAGVEARVLDAGLHRRPLAAARRELDAFRPDLVGLSLRNADNVSFPATRTYVSWYERLAAAVRGHTGGDRRPLVLGGPGFAIFAPELLRRLDADAGVVGDGEAAAVEFALEGVARRVGTGGRRDTGPRPGEEPAIVERPLDDLTNVRLPSDLTGACPGAERYRTAGVQTARGCPHGCVYCTYPRLEGARLRRRPAEAVADEMERLRRELGATEQFVVDSSFNADERHMAAVCEELARRRRRPGAALAGVSFSCYLQPLASDPSVFGLLRAAGCTSADFGVDSAAEPLLAGLGKRFTIDDLRGAVRAAAAAGLDVCVSLAFGGPGETGDTVTETVRVMDELAPTAVIAMTGLRIYPGTKLAAQARAAGLVGQHDPLLEPRFYVAGRLADDPGAAWLFRRVREATAARRSWFMPGARDWSAAWGPRLLRRLGKPGPLWRSFPRPRWYRYV